MEISRLSRRFEYFAKNECEGSSPLYETLSFKIAKDSEILELCLHAREGQPVPNLLFGAVHYLLLQGKEHALKQYYPSIVKHPSDRTEAFSHFKDFCMLFANEITVLLQTKLVQTNEVRRCAYLYPGFCFMYDQVNKPLSLIEIGTSAGLQLMWDKYRYSYGGEEVYGDPHSPVHITAEIRGKGTPVFTEFPPVASKIGLDLHINDLRNEEDYLWLKSLIWPEHEERLQMFEAARKCFYEDSVELIEGDGVAMLNEVIAKLPNDTMVGFFHTHVANQFPENLKHSLMAKIKEIGQHRDVFHFYNNMWDQKLHLDYFIGGVEYNQIIGETDGHGRWFEWNLD